MAAAAHAFNEANAFILPAVDMAQVFAPQITPAPKLAMRADDAAQVQLFLDSPDEDYEYAASVVQACSDATLYAIQCTEGGVSPTCGSNAEVVTITANPSEFKFSSSVQTVTQGITVKGVVQEVCTVDYGASSAVCGVTIQGSAQGQKTKTTTTTTYTGGAFVTNDVAITAGAEKTASPSGKCNAAAGLDARVWTALGVAAAAVFAIAL